MEIHVDLFTFNAFPLSDSGSLLRRSSYKMDSIVCVATRTCKCNFTIQLLQGLTSF